MRIHKVLRTKKSLESVFAYLSEFTTTTQWDPGTVKTICLEGDGTVGTKYSNTSTFAGRETQLIYVVKEFIPNERIVLRGENKTVVAVDTMTFRKVGNETEVTYNATFSFKGPAKFYAPLLKLSFIRLGNKAIAGMAQALEKL